MSAAAFWSDVIECRRLLRHYRQVQEEVKRPSAGWRFARTLLPWAVVPLLGLPWWDVLGIPFWVGIGLLGMVSVGSLPIRSPWQLTTFEALHMPSRRALFIARLLPWLPWWLWAGLWGTAGLLMAHWGKVQNTEQAALYLLVGAQVPWLVLGVFAFQPLMPRFGCGVMFACWILLSPLVGVLLAFLAQAGINPLREFHAYRALVPALMLLLEVGLLVLLVWSLGRLPVNRAVPDQRLVGSGNTADSGARQGIPALGPERPQYSRRARSCTPTSGTAWPGLGRYLFWPRPPTTWRNQRFLATILGSRKGCSSFLCLGVIRTTGGSGWASCLRCCFSRVSWM